MHAALKFLGAIGAMHYNMALMQGSCSIISLFRALGLFLYQNPPVAQPLFSIVPTDRKPVTG